MTARWLYRAVETAIRRHAGMVVDVYTPTGKRQVVRGKDLSAVKMVIGTGGALARIRAVPGVRSICTGRENICSPPGYGSTD